MTIIGKIYQALGVDCTYNSEMKNQISHNLSLEAIRSDVTKVTTDDVERSTTGRELRKCLEGALYGQDTEEFVVAQPYCIANKNLDFGKPKILHKNTFESRKKVENWMSKHVNTNVNPTYY